MNNAQRLIKAAQARADAGECPQIYIDGKRKPGVMGVVKVEDKEVLRLPLWSDAEYSILWAFIKQE